MRSVRPDAKVVEMTKQETFKRRIRARMERTGERYTTARQSLLERKPADRRHRVSEPEMHDDRIREATGKGWDEWCDLIDAWPGRDRGHTAIAAHVNEEHGIDGWWSQAVTVGYERITGLRLPHQRPDGTFTAGKSKVVAVEADVLRRLLVEDEHRRDLFPGQDTELRSRPASKTIRLGIGGGVALIDIEERDDGRTRVGVAHEKLPDPDAVERWKFYWAEWLDALDGG